MTKYKTAESVRRGHPDKLCDLIVDSILDECLRHDRYSRCACEVMATKGKIFVCGEITCAAKINIRSVVREVLRKVGYNPMKFIVFVYVHRQSPTLPAVWIPRWKCGTVAARMCSHPPALATRAPCTVTPPGRPGPVCPSRWSSRMKSAKDWMTPCTMGPSVASALMARPGDRGL